MAENKEPDEIKVGDVVYLKGSSKGPTMTVQSVTRSGTDDVAKCSWFDSNGKLVEGKFALAGLELYENSIAAFFKGDVNINDLPED